eukprot:scaffold23154_cov67-Phaeocystis_antarctica.AAC.4
MNTSQCDDCKDALFDVNLNKKPFPHCEDGVSVLCVEKNCKNGRPSLRTIGCAAQAEPFYVNPEDFPHTNDNLLLVNGQFEPKLNITANTWVRSVSDRHSNLGATPIAANPAFSSRAPSAHLSSISSLSDAKCSSWPRTASSCPWRRAISRKGCWRRATARTCSSTVPLAASSSNHSPSHHVRRGFVVPSTARFCISIPWTKVSPRSAICPSSKSTGRAVTGCHSNLGLDESAYRLILCSPRAFGRPRRPAQAGGSKKPDV